MRIGIDISQLAYPGTGVAVYTEQLVRHLLKVDKKNEYLLFGSSLRKQESLELVNYFSHQTMVKRKIFVLPQTFLRFLWNQLHLVNIEHFSGKLDVFHSSDWVEPPARAKKVTTIHDLLVYKYPDHIPPTIVSNQRQKLKWVKKESDLIIVDSKSTRDDAIDILGVERERLRVIYLGVSEQFVPQPAKEIEKIKAKYNIEKDYLLTMGGHEPRKNIDKVIDAYHSLSLSRDLQLVVVGPFSPENRPPQTKGVVFVQSVAYQDLPAIYSGADCFVYPSLYEGFGLPVLEAMRCGCPVVTSNRGSLREVAGEAAKIINPESVESIADGIRSVVDSSDNDYVNMVMHGFSWAKKFSWTETAGKTLKVYQEAVSLD